MPPGGSSIWYRLSPRATRSLLAAVTLMLLLQPACRPPFAAADDTLITSLRFSPSAFDSFRRNTELKYILKVPATVSLYVVKRDSAGGEVLVKTLAEGLRETQGSHATTWLGDTNDRLFAPAGIYVGVVAAGSRRFETTVQVFHF